MGCEHYRRMTDPSDRLVFARDLVGQGDTRRQHSRAAAAGAEVRVSRGVYADTVAVAQLDARAKYLLLVRAVAETRRNRPVVSHWSAAALHGLPILGPWPRSVHITQLPTTGTRSGGDVVRHTLQLDDEDVTEIDGLLVTTVGRTAVDLAASATTVAAAVVVDAVLHLDRFGRIPPLSSIDELWEVWGRKLPFRGHSRSSEVLDFASAQADTPIESVSRVTMRTIGCPVPVLQLAHLDDDGFIAETDFAWPEFGVVGEADGDRKYLDAAFRSDKSVEQVVLDEKIREDRLRALPRTVARWRWSTALSPRLLHRSLTRAGVPLPRLRRR
jgi:hypothetical protein